MFFSGLFLSLLLAERWRKPRITEGLRVFVGKKKDAGMGRVVSLVGWMLPQSEHPVGNKLVCWGCVLWVVKCRIADPDSRHC